MKHLNHILLVSILTMPFWVLSQEVEDKFKIQQITIDTDSIKIAEAWSDGEVDDMPVVYIKEVPIIALREFESPEEEYRYNQLKYNVDQVYNYAVEACLLFDEVEAETQGMNKRQKKKHTRSLHKRYKEKFEDPLRSLTKTQGKILVLMVEKYTDDTVYNLVKEAKSGTRAFFYQKAGKMYGYNLKTPYDPNEIKYLDDILSVYELYQ